MEKKRNTTTSKRKVVDKEKTIKKVKKDLSSKAAPKKEIKAIKPVVKSNKKTKIETTPKSKKVNKKIDDHYENIPDFLKHRPEPTEVKTVVRNANKEVNKKAAKIVDAKINKKSKRKFTIIISIIFSILLIIGLSYFLLKHKMFNLNNIEIKGNSKVTSEEIMLKSEIGYTQNLFSALYNINKKEILKIPYVNKIDINFKIPDKLVINVIERESSYYAFDKETNKYYKIDKEGVILNFFDKIEFRETEVLVLGITFDKDLVLGTKVNEIDLAKLKNFENIKEETSEYITNKNITKVNFENDLIKIYLDDKIEVVLSNSINLNYSLNFLKNILNNLGDVVGTIDMTKENPTFIAL